MEFNGCRGLGNLPGQRGAETIRCLVNPSANA